MIMKRNVLGSANEFWISEKFRVVVISKYAGDNNYSLTFYIDKRNIDILMYVTDFKILSDRESINNDINSEVTKMNANHKFDKYMDDYNKMIKYLNKFEEEFDK